LSKAPASRSSTRASSDATRLRSGSRMSRLRCAGARPWRSSSP